MQSETLQKPKSRRKNLTRFTYDNTAFQGWRLAVCREGKSFIKYFSDRQYGNGDKALKAAEKTLQKILHTLNSGKKLHGKLTQDVIDQVKQLIK